MALMHARFKRVVFGARDPKTGVAGSVMDLFADKRLNHHTTVQPGVLEDTCGALLREFFAERRAQQRQQALAERAEAANAAANAAALAGEGGADTIPVPEAEELDTIPVGQAIESPDDDPLPPAHP
jgi:tRNA(adenine34) deaminase